MNKKVCHSISSTYETAVHLHKTRSVDEFNNSDSELNFILEENSAAVVTKTLFSAFQSLPFPPIPKGQSCRAACKRQLQ